MAEFYNYTVKYNQSIIDVVVQEYGDISQLVTLADDNNITPSHELVAGQVLKIRTDNTTKRLDIVNYYSDRGTILATLGL